MFAQNSPHFSSAINATAHNAAVGYDDMTMACVNQWIGLGPKISELE